MRKYSITLLPSGKAQTFYEGTLLLDALMDMGVYLETPCGGKGICGKCKIKAEGRLTEKTELEKKSLKDQPDYRLACQAYLQGDAHIFIDDKTVITPKSYPSIDLDKRYSIAVDVGTTTVQISLVNLQQNRSYMLDTFLNPQRRFGHDVITRISASSDSTIFCQLVQQIRERIFSSISQALRQISLPYNKIESLVFSGNTTMLHLLFELEVSSMGIYPYHTKRLNFNDFKPADIGADMFPHSQIYALPTVSSFLGGDLTGGLTLCYEMGLRSHTFFIDLGTNGELSLINSAGEIFATSCAMGPALEGMNISCGMTADVGAITHVWTDKGSLRYEMIGDSTPVGITGTALIDILSILLEENILTDEGAFAKDIDSMLLPSPAKYLLKGNVKQINLWGDISLTQKDVRNVQLAKGASLTASRILLKEAGCSSEEIEQVIIAGAFGKHLNMDNFKRLKFIPGFSAASYHFLGNTSLKAAERACFEQNFLKKASLIRDRVHEIELSMRPTFNKEFIDALNF